MKTRIRFAALLLGLALCATGCSSIGLRDRTVVLPTPEPALTLTDDAAAEAFTVQNIDQFAFQTDCLSPGGTRTPIGFAEGDLYIVSGAPGQDLCVKRVDPRYGFYEEAADLGAIDYNDIRLSPDGRYLLYDETDHENGVISLYLFDVEAGKSRLVYTCPWASSLLRLDYCFSGDGESFFCWLTFNDNPRIWDADYEWFGGIPTIDEDMDRVFGQIGAENLPLNEVLRGACQEGEAETYFTLETMEETPDYAYGVVGDLGSAYQKEVLVSADGSRVAITTYTPEYGRTCRIVEDGAEDAAESERYTALLQDGGELLQITPDAVLGTCVRDGDYLPFLGRGTGSVVYWTELSLANANLIDLRLAPDGAHILTAEYGANGECVVCLYPLDAGRQPMQASRRVLYQSLQEYADLLVTPEQDRVVVLSHSYLLAESEVAEAYSGDKYAPTPRASDASALRASFIATVLEM